MNKLLALLKSFIKSAILSSYNFEFITGNLSNSCSACFSALRVSQNGHSILFTFPLCAVLCHASNNTHDDRKDDNASPCHFTHPVHLAEMVTPSSELYLCVHFRIDLSIALLARHNTCGLSYHRHNKQFFQPCYLVVYSLHLSRSFHHQYSFPVIAVCVQPCP